jgi:hypothetical protein
MAQKQQGRKVYRSMQGKSVDMDLLRKRNELTPAVGNARVNARGDELGPGGKIIRKKEDVVKEYYKNSHPVADEPARATTQAAQPVVAETAAPRKKTTRAQEKVQAVQPTASELEEFDSMDDAWIEDESGNFVKKGE